MKKSIFRFCALLILAVSVVLLLVGLSSESFGFNGWWFFAVWLYGEGLLVLIQSVLEKNGSLSVAATLLLVIATVFLCIALSAEWFWYVGGVLLAAVFGAMARILFKVPKWNAMNNERNG